MNLETFYLLYKTNADDVEQKTKKLMAAQAEFDKHLTKGESDRMKAKKAVIAAEKELAESQKKSKEQTEELNNSYEKVIGNLTAIAAAYVGISAVRNGIGNSVSFTSNLEMNSKWLDINARDLASWQGVLKSVGGSAEDFDSAIKNLHDSYVKMGMNVNGSQLLENLLKLSDVMHNNPNQAEAIGLKFGFSEPMILALEKGRSNIEGILAAQEKINGVTEKGNAISRDFTTQWERTKDVMQGLWITLDNLILPTITKLLKKFDESTFISDIGTKGVGGATQGLIDRQNHRGEVRRILMKQKGIGWNDVDPADIDAYIAGESPAAAPPASATPSNGSGGTLGIQSNNPGNLQPGGREAVYATADQGLQAMAANLRRYGARGWDTIDAIASHWAPAGGKGNSPASEEAYKQALERSLGKKRGDKLDLMDQDTLDSLMHGMIMQENAGQDPYGDAMIRKAIASGAMPMKMSSNTPFNSSSISTTSTGGDKNVTVQINEINVQTQATDANAISAGISSSLKNQLRSAASNWDDGILA